MAANRVWMRSEQSVRSEGLVFSHELKFFEPANVPITQMASRFLENHDAMETPISPIGAGDGI
jgi:hypothetical protein